jgi:hypothetical protein
VTVAAAKAKKGGRLDIYTQWIIEQGDLEGATQNQIAIPVEKQKWDSSKPWSETERAIDLS